MSNEQNTIDANACKVLVKGRISYAHVWEPARIAKDPKSPLKYSLSVIIEKSDKEQIDRITKAINAAYAIGMASTKATQSLKGIDPKRMEMPFKDADQDFKKKDDEVYKGKYFISCKSDTQPRVLDERKEEMIDKTKFYSGCYAYVSINFFPFNNVASGIGAGLNNIMKIADGVALGGKQSAEVDFADIQPVAGNQPAITPVVPFNLF